MFKHISVLLASLVLSAAAQAAETFKFNQLNWQSAGMKGVDMAVLWGSEADHTAVYAFRIQPGVVIPAHTHSRDYWGVAVQGRWVHVDAHGKRVTTGQEAFVRIQGQDSHADSCVGPKACINLVDFDGARDIFFPQK